MNRIELRRRIEKLECQIEIYKEDGNEENYDTYLELCERLDYLKRIEYQDRLEEENYCYQRRYY